MEPTAHSKLLYSRRTWSPTFLTMLYLTKLYFRVDEKSHLKHLWPRRKVAPETLQPVGLCFVQHQSHNGTLHLTVGRALWWQSWLTSISTAGSGPVRPWDLSGLAQGHGRWGTNPSHPFPPCLCDGAETDEARPAEHATVYRKGRNRTAQIRRFHPSAAGRTGQRVWIARRPWLLPGAGPGSSRGSSRRRSCAVAVPSPLARPRGRIVAGAARYMCARAANPAVRCRGCPGSWRNSAPPLRLPPSPSSPLGWVHSLGLVSSDAIALFLHRWPHPSSLKFTDQQNSLSFPSSFSFSLFALHLLVIVRFLLGTEGFEKNKKPKTSELPPPTVPF